MILYFTGTGNSEFVARTIGSQIDDDVMNLFEKIRHHDYSDLLSDKPWIIVTPTYAWRIPRIVSEWLRKTSLKGNQNIYYVMTCAGSRGNADKYLQQLSDSKGLYHMGSIEVMMPENYIALFDTTKPHDIPEMMKDAEEKVMTVCQYIKQNIRFPQNQITMKDRLNSGIVNDLFYPVFVHAKKFYVTNQCISCGKCVQVCALNNIHLIDGKPIWDNDCTHCMACISRCPQEAIEYGKKSIGKIRYVCPYK